MNEKIIQITAGRGPAECCWVVAQVLKKLLKEVDQLDIEYVIIHRERGMENGTLFSVTLKLKGDKVGSILQEWLGTIQWIGQSKFRKFHKRKNWFVAINLLNDAWQDNDFREQDVRYEFTRSGGPGGQHVNKVSTAVRASHIPSGEVVFVAQGRSQLQNKKEALRRLKYVLDSKTLSQVKEQIKDGWENHNQLDRGNPVKVFKGNDFKPNHQRNKYKSSRKSSKQNMFRQLDD